MVGSTAAATGGSTSSVRAVVLVVELGLVALFVLGWVSASPSPDAPLAAPPPAGAHLLLVDPVGR